MRKGSQRRGSHHIRNLLTLQNHFQTCCRLGPFFRFIHKAVTTQLLFPRLVPPPLSLLPSPTPKSANTYCTDHGLSLPLHEFLFSNLEKKSLPILDNLSPPPRSFAGVCLVSCHFLRSELSRSPVHLKAVLLVCRRTVLRCPPPHAQASSREDAGRFICTLAEPSAVSSSLKNAPVVTIRMLSSQ